MSKKEIKQEIEEIQRILDDVPLYESERWDLMEKLCDKEEELKGNCND